MISSLSSYHLLVPITPSLNTTLKFISDNNYIDVSVESIVSILTSTLYITLN